MHHIFVYNRYDQCKNDSSFIKSANKTFNGRAAKKKWANVIPLGKTGNPKEEIMNLFPELFDGIGCVNTLYRIKLMADAHTACKTCGTSCF